MRSASNIRLTSTLLVFVLLTGFAGSAAAVKFGDPKAGKKKSQENGCVACHGVDNDNPQFPRIAGQHPDYLLHALKAYKSGDRQNAVMSGQVGNLTVEDMEDLAAYYGSLDSDLETMELD